MAVGQVQEDKATKDGRRWFFYTYVHNSLTGETKKYSSKLYPSKQTALKAERDFRNAYEKKELNLSTMTFQDLYESFLEYKKDKVKKSTYSSYSRRIKYLEPILNIKIKDFSIKHYQNWRAEICKLHLAVKTKNGFHKMLKELLNYGTKWFDFNFNSIYNKMEKFEAPDALPKEMQYYTYEEFQQFMSVEDDIKFKCIFETLYFCGLRRGELRGLTWDNIDFFNKELTVNKNCVNENGDAGFWHLTTPKTKTSNRVLPLPDVLVNDLKEYKEYCKKHQYGWNIKYFVFGDINPLHPYILNQRKNHNAEVAGVKQIRIHDFRHSCASLLINNNANIMVVAKYLGHTKIDETLNTYTHLFKSSMNQVIDLINNLNNTK